jgi:hypothetical protein
MGSGGGGGKTAEGVYLTTHFHLVSRLRMSGAIPILPLMLCLYVSFMKREYLPLISIAKLKEPTKLLPEKDGLHELSYFLFAAITASPCVTVVTLAVLILTYQSHLILFDSHTVCYPSY